MEVLRTAFQTSLVLEWGGAVAVALVAVEISLRLMAGAIEFERALAVLIIVPEFFLPLRQLATRYHSGAAGRAVGDPDVRDPRRAGAGDATVAEPRPACPRPPSPAGARSASDGRRRVTYPGRTEPALRGLDLDDPAARPGRPGRGDRRGQVDGREPAAAVHRARRRRGSSSATCRWPTSTSRAWRAHVAWVPQRPHLFHGHDRRQRPAGPSPTPTTRPSGAALRRCRRRRRSSPACRSATRRRSASDGRPAQRRAATADRDRPGDPRRRPARHPRRGDLAARRGERERRSATRIVARSHATGPSSSCRTGCGWPPSPTSSSSSRPGRVVETGAPGRAAPQRDGAYAAAASTRDTTPDPEVARVTTFRRLFGLLAGQRRWIAIGALLGFLAVGSNVALMATVGLPDLEAALVTNVAEVALAITAVRVLAIGRAAFRYLERYVTHRATFAILADLRVWFFAAIEPLAPAGLAGHRRGDLLAPDRRRHRHARGLLRPRRRPAGRRRARDGVRQPAARRLRPDPRRGRCSRSWSLTGVVLPLASRRLARAAGDRPRSRRGPS